MSQSRASLINTTLSLMVVDATAMPPNLGHSQKEDYPESLFRVVAYDGKNILPTALGYRSHFSEQTLFSLPSLPSTHVQEIIAYQGVDYAVYLLALCEEGAYIINATQGQSGTEWTYLFNSQNDPASNIRHQWTSCVVANQLYFFQQGQPAYYAVCTKDYYDNNRGQTLIPKAVVTPIFENGSFGVLKIVPSFINMAGQVGLFRADTRLAFWDSANSISWSSATQVYDFTPSVTTFAGNTIFADIVGKITKVIGQGDGFIIYASRSVVRVIENAGSQELWSGTALLSNAGVAFDTQCCASQPDDTHYALTGSGLYQISGGQVEPIEVEVSDYLMENALVYACKVLDSRYLFLHSDKDLIPSYYDIGTFALDMDGNQYEFKPNVDPAQASNAQTITKAALEGATPGSKADFSYSAKPTTTPAQANITGTATIPCYTGDGLSTNFDETVLPSGQSQDLTVFPMTIVSGIDDSQSYDIKGKINKPRFTNYTYDVDEHFDDKAAEDFQAEIQKTFDLVKEMGKVVVDGSTLFVNGSEYERVHDSAIVQIAEPIGFTKTTKYPKDPTLSWTWRNLFESTQGNATKSSCGYNLDARMQDIKFNVEVQVDEVVDSYYTIWAAGSGGTVGIAYCGSVEAYLAGGYAEVGLPTPSIQEAKWLIISGGDIPFNTLGYVPANAAAVTVANAIWEGGWQIGDIILPDAVQIPYPGVLGHGQSPPSSGDCFGVGLHQALGGSMSWSVVNYTPPPPVLVGECGDAHTTTQPNYSLVSGLAGSVFMGACQGKETVSIGKLDGATCIPDAQVKSDKINYAFVTGISRADIADKIIRAVELSPQDAEIQAAYNQLKKKLRLSSVNFNITTEVVPLEEVTPIIESEVSGYGYQPSGGFSFRKTHSRSPGSPCNGGSGSTTVPINPSGGGGPTDPSTVPLDTATVKPKPPTKWNYPQPIPRPAITSLFQVGTPAPFYPSYHSAIVYDLHFKKWGRYDNEHQVVFETMPTNRVDHTVVPTVDQGIRAGAYKVSAQALTFFTPDNANSAIVYGKIGKYREGVTTGTKAIAHFSKPAYGNMIVELSRDGSTVDQASSLYVPLEGVLSVTFPFTESAKWFNIRIEGQFDLTYLEFESAATGRR